MACSFFNIGNDVAMQAVAIGFIIGVVQDSVETALNSSGDVFFTATAEFYDRKKKNKPKGCYLFEKTCLRACFFLKNHKFLRFVR